RGIARIELTLRRGVDAASGGFPALLTTSPASGGQLRIVLVDLSDRRRMEREHDEALALFRQIAESIDELFYVAEPGGAFVYLSPAYARIFGREPAGLDPVGWLDALHPDDRARVREARAA